MKLICCKIPYRLVQEGMYVKGGRERKEEGYVQGLQGGGDGGVGDVGIEATTAVVLVSNG